MAFSSAIIRLAIENIQTHTQYKKINLISGTSWVMAIMSLSPDRYTPID